MTNRFKSFSMALGVSLALLFGATGIAAAHGGGGHGGGGHGGGGGFHGGGGGFHGGGFGGAVWGASAAAAFAVLRWGCRARSLPRWGCGATAWLEHPG